MSEKTITLTPEQFNAAIQAAIQAAGGSTKPAELSEFQKLKQEDEENELRAKLGRRKQDEIMRKQRGEQELAMKAGLDFARKHCRHTHMNGQAAIAELYDLGAVICLHCQAMIKPAPAPNDPPDRFIYDETMYYNLMASRAKTTF